MKDRRIIREATIFILIVLVVLLPRIPGYDEHATIDEPYWVRYSTNFYMQFARGNYSELTYEYHPAVTTFWSGTLGLLMEFPEHRGLGTHFEKEKLMYSYFEENGHSPFEVFQSMRFATVLINSALFVILFYGFRYWLGLYPATFATLVLAFDPYHFGHSRMMTHEAMMTLFMLISLVFMMIYLYKSRAWWGIVTSGIFAALAMLTKSTSTMIVLFLGLLLLIEFVYELFWKADERDWSVVRKVLLKNAKIFSTWLLVCAVAYIVIWPGMWEAPGKMLTSVYGVAYDYAFEGHRYEEYAGTITAEEVGFVESSLNRAVHYFKALLERSTPLVWGGMLLVPIAAFVSYKDQRNTWIIRSIANFFLYAFFFWAMMSMTRARASDHYVMSVFVILDILAALGLALGVQWLGTRFEIFKREWARWGILFFMVGIQIWNLVPGYPYYYNYCNPLIEANGYNSCQSVIGYGMGLDLAAEYLAEKPGAEGMQVMSWAGYGPFSYFFPGEIAHISPTIPWDQKRVDQLRESDYLVIYPVTQLAKNEPKELLAALEGVEPEHVIWIDGIEYVWIYKVSELPADVFVAGPYD